MKIELFKKDRYVTLEGDPIQKGLAKSMYLSAEFAVAVGAAGAWLAATTPNAVEGIFGTAMILHTAFAARAVEDDFLKALNDPDLNGGKRVCIDKRPSDDAVKKSLGRHFDFMRAATGNYQLWTSAATATATLMGGWAAALGGSPEMAMLPAAGLVGAAYRGFKGLYRFNKLEKGEWAIVERPSTQEKIPQISFETGRSSAAGAPVQARDSAGLTLSR